MYLNIKILKIMIDIFDAVKLPEHILCPSCGSRIFKIGTLHSKSFSVKCIGCNTVWGMSLDDEGFVKEVIIS